jgi:lipopolysaccharide transport system ATP-binding protein
VIGVIGRNGAGKSTLLKILSRITEPTSGEARIRGRVASLLEVGTGFHPELSGRENIFLNGAILGMTKAEVRSKFDEIVAFAEIEKFIDTPVKRYSSGMYVRLAFAVAAHLEPEILIVDEVLAVGDLNFQRKCLGKMKTVSSQDGRTVLFVSHNTSALQGICTRGLLLKAGQLVVNDGMDTVIRAYIGTDPSTFANGWSYRNKGKQIKVESLELLREGLPTQCILSGDACSFRLKYRVLDPSIIGKHFSVSLILYSDDRKETNLWTNCHGNSGMQIGEECGYIDCSIERWPFRASRFRVEVFTHIGPETQDWIEDCLVFQSEQGDFYRSGTSTNPDQGILFLNHYWTSHNAPK